ncbi:MAG: hypothetical protein WCI74_03235, partial [Actinomycetes bacterium]
MAMHHSPRNRRTSMAILVRWLRFSAAVAAVALLAALVGPAGPAHAADATLGLTKTALTTDTIPDEIKPGEAVEYTLNVSCSSLQFGCVDATITDILPAELNPTALPPSNSERKVTYDPATRKLTIQFLLPLTTPPGTFGLPAGSGRTVKIGMGLPTETSVTDGQIIANLASVSATNADTKDAGASITAIVPVVVRPVATKAWSPSTGIAQSGVASTITLGVRNASSTSADVRQLRVTDQTSATFNAFDVTQLGPVHAYPPGANRITVGICTKPIGSPCGEGEWIESEQSGSGPFTPPGGTAPGAITGVRYTFLNSGGTTIPYSADQGTVDIGMVLRDTYRDSGLPIQPQTRLTVTNQAAPVAIVNGG